MSNSNSSSRLTRWKDSVAKGLWSGDVREADPQGTHVGNLSGTRVSKPLVAKADGMRRGQVPEHIESPQQGRPRPFNPFGLRKLADTETVQACVDTIKADIRGIDTLTEPVDEQAAPSDELMANIERALDDLNPNPHTHTQINDMLLTDLLEVGNAVCVQHPQVEGRQAEAIPLDPNTFTVDVDTHGILQGYWQYAQAGNGYWGEPQQFDTEEVMWLTLNPETTRMGFYGHSPVEKLQNVINVMGGLLEKETKELEEGMPPGIISLVGDSWSDSDYQAFETYWSEEVKGNQHKVPYTRGEAEFTPFTMSYKEMQVLDRQKWYSKLVGSIFKVPISETGLAIGEEMTRATDVSQRQKYKQKAIRPLLDTLESGWNSQYIHRWWSEGVEWKYNPGLDLMEEQELSKIHDRRLKNGTATINEVREKLGKDSVEWGDEPFDLRTWASAEYGAGPSLSGLASLDGGDDDTDPDGEQSAEMDNQDALTEGQTANQTPTQSGGQIEQQKSSQVSGQDFSDSLGYGSDSGTWLPEGVEVPTEKALRENVGDDYTEFTFQPREIEALHHDLEQAFAEAIEGVLNQVKGNQQLLRDNDGGIAKSVSEFMKLIEEEIGLSFAQDIATILTAHKRRKVLDGKDEILNELKEAGLSLDAITIEEVTDRVTERIQQRTLRITKPISDRLESDLRDVLTEGWQQGHGITDIERNIEELTDKWRGHQAERLARDQLGKAAKEGRLAYAQETSQEVGGWEKIWLSTPDHRTRDSHAAMDGATARENEPFIVDYSMDGGPERVEELYPGESRWGIQCRCDYKLTPADVVKTAKSLSENPTPRMEEIEKQESQPIHEVLLRVEHSSVSRNQAAKDLGISKNTLYDWLSQAGLR